MNELWKNKTKQQTNKNKTNKQTTTKQTKQTNKQTKQLFLNLEGLLSYMMY